MATGLIDEAKDVLGDVPEAALQLRSVLGSLYIPTLCRQTYPGLGSVVRTGDKITLHTLCGYTETHDYVEYDSNAGSNSQGSAR